MRDERAHEERTWIRPAREERPALSRFTSRVAFLGALVTAIVVFWSAPLVPFEVLAAVLVALLLDGFGGVIRRAARWALRGVTLPRWIGLVLAILTFAGTATATIAYLGPALSDQADLVRDKLPEAVRALERDLSQFALGRAILEEAPSASEVEETLEGGKGRPAGREADRQPAPELTDEGDDGISFGSVFSSTFGLLTDVVIIIVLGLYLAANPMPYVRGFIRLFPPPRRPQVTQVLAELQELLERWLAGRFIGMITITTLTWLGLTLIGLPFALSLAVLAGALSFIPNLGPIISAVPGVLLALLQGGLDLALAAGAVYLVTQLLESYVVTPQVDKRAVHIPPALLLLAQVLSGVLFGLIGLVLATPLTVVALVLVRRFYVEGALGDAAPDLDLSALLRADAEAPD